ncbi:DUF4232 domain-containing protein [Streptomyces sp. H34-S5]|nr:MULTISPECIES: DUF4232 domain-containing protein [unclassified Streptomyces]MCY0943000.1 DUF4232 domain-containing protein [Streptomyces sp. H34-AA3]MCZ4086307.1 DUF4232 domain-containing protein [Streptomyces sp. H34-S5]
MKDDSRLLLVVTNTGTEPCTLRTHPVLRPMDGHGRLVEVFMNSRPQAEVTLAPGKEAYAGLLLRQSSKDVGTLVKDMALAPHGQSPDSPTGEGVLIILRLGYVTTLGTKPQYPHRSSRRLQPARTLGVRH